METLSSVSTPVLDRASCERLFGVRRRQAINLMQHFGGYQAGRALLVDRAELLRQLQILQTAPGVEQECRRRQRLVDQLETVRQTHAARRVFIVPSPVDTTRSERLPDGVALLSGKLTLEFSSIDQLLSRLYSLAQSIASDYSSFASLITSTDSYK